MEYLVTMEMTGAAPASSPQELVQFLERVVIPSEEAVVKLEAEKKILAGGDMSGRKGWAFIMDAASNEELSYLLQSIPQWPMLKVDVTPLYSSKDNLASLRKMVEQMKAAEK
jgi:muconolactone D-isomerase